MNLKRVALMLSALPLLGCAVMQTLLRLLNPHDRSALAANATDSEETPTLNDGGVSGNEDGDGAKRSQSAVVQRHFRQPQHMRYA
ncbi:hypothetical protein BT93_L2623 [Corymbia citriodora subsp. variegata]|uniref:Secreted protein n=1 Tax=Corymbia citriodora subsp. variegata TaxID=360336 RepID=A0A8T0CX76_CORYI|nr:hypothetical protein BT93_L2623 [Corymbia citriodora subsp. variegata]